MRRRPGDGDVIIPFDLLVKENIDSCEETLVGHGFDETGGEELCTKVGDKIVARADVQGYSLAPPPDPSEDVVDGTDFPCVASGPHCPNPGGAGSGRDNRSPKRLSLVRASDNYVNSPACRAVGKRRTVDEEESGGSLNKGSPGPVDLAK